MQPNTSLAALSSRFPWAFLCTCLCAYYTIFPSGGRSVLPTFWNIWYNCLIKLNALLVRPREYLYIPKDNGLRAGCGNVFCRVPFVGCCQVVVDRVRTFCFRAPRLFPAASKTLARSKTTGLMKRAITTLCLILFAAVASGATVEVSTCGWTG